MSSIKRALRLKSRAKALLGHGQLTEARQQYLEACRLDDRDLEAWVMLGIVEGMLGNLPEAEKRLRHAVRINPDLPEAHLNLGNILKLQGRLAEAIDAYGRAAQLRPDVATLINLGNTLKQCDRLEEAVECLRQAVSRQPDNANAHYNLGSALRAQGKLDDAVAAYQCAIRLRQGFAEAHNNLGVVLLDQQKIDDAMRCYREALRLKPDYVMAHSNLLHALNYQSLEASVVFHEYRLWDQQHARPQPRYSRYANAPDPERRLRIGYVSSDLRQHSVAFFIEPLLTQHDRAMVEVVCYSDVARPDDTTRRLKGAADLWRDIHGLSDERVAEQIYADNVDILVDLVGHVGAHRLLVFARKPAPLQVSYLGYPNTTGLATMDYRFTDAWADPPGQTEAFHSETLLRLAPGFLCYQPPPDAPEIGPLPAYQGGHVTFGSFNHFTKVNAEVIETWAAILRAVPGARLLMKHNVLADAGVRKQIWDLFSRNGVDQERVSLLGPAPSLIEHLNTYNRVDIALDTFPYNGTTTTCEALWMGVPVITVAGHAHVERVGVSLLSQLQLAECIAQDHNGYIETAVRMAADLDRLSELRAALRQRMQDSPLCDAKTFARKVEYAYRSMWKKWCAQQAGESA
ncbi:tetratricopeptide repeat protein [Sulfuricaulis sp.]|uniref:O-linked N-acetylglucosamine transferase, SPINDLY family protein n=1 Tax=Sulfuricaulis sp. TaxID=2003553 RepID=UPI003559EF79